MEINPPIYYNKTLETWTSRLFQISELSLISQYKMPRYWTPHCCCCNYVILIWCLLLRRWQVKVRTCNVIIESHHWQPLVIINIKTHRAGFCYVSKTDLVNQQSHIKHLITNTPDTKYFLFNSKLSYSTALEWLAGKTFHIESERSRLQFQDKWWIPFSKCLLIASHKNTLNPIRVPSDSTAWNESHRDSGTGPATNIQVLSVDAS